MNFSRDSLSTLDIQYLAERRILEIECPSSVSRDNEMQNTNKTLANPGQEVTIPCTGVYHNTTTIPIYFTEGMPDCCAAKGIYFGYYENGFLWYNFE
ncbi:hypothetical protein D915_010854 [Fasciola hepatica]|uniref:Uncharacterized protein n=1 Tax=Fasciola hepatica TaxID=6192 RepID=A0A4E0QV92_FASHE|nr:hypothetical protein D915_010854 [Fasciola hepatica]